MNTAWSNLAKIVAKRTYARPVMGGPRLETWAETVERTIWGNIRLDPNVEEREINKLRELMLARKAGPAGRGYWFSGTKSHQHIGGVALNNCWAETSADWHNFVEAADLLMLGGGVGMSVEHRYTSKLPKVKRGVVITHQPTKDADLIVADSREGWDRLLYKVLKSFFVTGKSFTYSTICVRGYGEAIKGFGGTSSGPGPLIELVTKLCGILQAREGRSIRPIDAADMLCAIAEMVVAGNVRRSALIIIGDCFDKEFLKAKRMDLGDIPTQRSTANFSVYCDDVDDLHPLYWATYEHGEAFGIVNRTNIQKYGRMGELKKDTAIAVNPCVTADTWVMTAEGPRQVRQLIKKPFYALLNGSAYYSPEGFFSTGTQDVFEVCTTRGHVIRATGNHRFYTMNGWKCVEEIRPGDEIVLQTHPDAEWEGTTHLGQRFEDGWLLGEMVGNGCHNFQTSNSYLKFWGPSAEEMKDYAVELVRNLGEYYHCPTRSDFKGRRRDTCTEVCATILSDFANFFIESQTKEFKPALESDTSSDFTRGFLRGFFDADGTVAFCPKKGSSIRLNQSSLPKLRAVQRMLARLGILSTIFEDRHPEGTKLMPDGKGGVALYPVQANHDLVISRDAIEVFARRIGFREPDKQSKLWGIVNSRVRRPYRSTAKAKVHEVKQLPNAEAVYDCSVLNVNAYDSNGFTSHNCGEATLEAHEPCNLQDIALPNLESKEEFIEACVLMHRWGKRVTLEKYHHEAVQDVIDRNRRVGTSITGCLQSPLFVPATLNEAYAAIQAENVSYSKALGIPASIRTTTIKPSGTMSKVYDVDGEGIHPGFARYYTQRIRFASNDPAIPKLRAAGHHIEPVVRFDGSFDLKTVVVDFYRAVPLNCPTVDEGFDTWKQLDAVMLAQKCWSDQAVSVSVYYKHEDVPAIKNWLRDNLQNIKTVSFMPYIGHGFKQAPKEPLTAEQYEKLAAKVKPVELDDVADGGQLSGTECDGGACPIR